MSETARGVAFRCLLAFPVLVPAFGCGPAVDTTPASAVPVSQTPGEIELSDATVTVLEPKLVEFEVKYQFTRGRPDKFYSCEIHFPGTPNHGVRFMESWELKTEGVIRDKFLLSQPGAQDYEIHMAESTSPRERYKKISNVLKGRVP